MIIFFILHRISTMKIKCYFCRLSFETESLKILHLHESHPDVEANYECHFCERRFKYRYQIQNHLQSKGGEHRKPKPKPMPESNVCQLCDKRLYSPNSVKQHMMHVHKTEFECNICQKIFDRQGDLRKHSKTEHNGKSLKCDKCIQTFSCNKHLKRHKFLKKCKPISE